MDLEGIMLSEISQRKIPLNFTYVWSLKKNQTNKKKKERKTRPIETETDRMGTRGAGCGKMSEGDGGR